KYEGHYNYDKARVYYAMILENPEKARRINVDYRREREKVPLYEYARFFMIESDPNDIIEFTNAFPQSILMEPALGKLSSGLRNPETRDKTTAAYEALMKKYPGNSALVIPYVSYCAREKFNIDRALKLAEQYHEAYRDEADPNFLQPYADLLLQIADEKTALSVYGEDFVGKNKETWYLIDRYAQFWAEKGKNLQSALNASERAVEIRRAYNTLFTLSTVQWKMGKLKEAISSAEEALKLEPGFTRAERQIENIKKEMK
ncbi:hypothetical protein ACFL6I_27150, partial [candidate division KSB1 bacterium]